jgi:hypothetical protein
LEITHAATNNLEGVNAPVNGGAAIYSGARLPGTKEAGRTHAGWF